MAWYDPYQTHYDTRGKARSRRYELATVGLWPPPAASLDEIQRMRLEPPPPVLDDPALILDRKPVTEVTESDSGISGPSSLTTPVEPPRRTLLQDIRAELGLMLRGLLDVLLGDRGPR